MMRLFLSALLVSLTVFGAAKYTGPRPPKADLPYLLHADNLIPTDASEAKEETRKDTTVASVAGAASNARTPLAEPAFLIKTNKLVADKLSVYRLQVRNGVREVVTNSRDTKKVSKPIHVVVTKLEDGLYKIEVDEPLENGEYALSPDGLNDTFSFSIY